MKPLLLAAAASAALGSATLTAPVWAQASMAESQVNALEGLAGPQPGFRRSGAKGICASGHFVGNAAGRELSSASVFKGDKVPVVARFSVGGGSPKASDKSKSVRGLDCSGLVQVALEASGVSAPRDSDMQALGLGAPIDRNELRRGDLVFWKGHVAIMEDEMTMIHANGHTMTVARERLDDAIERIGWLYDAPTGYRRPIAEM